MNPSAKAALARAKARLAASEPVARAPAPPWHAPALSPSVWKSADGWRWRATARNGRIIAESGEAYSRERDAQRAWLRFEMLVKG